MKKPITAIAALYMVIAVTGPRAEAAPIRTLKHAIVCTEVSNEDKGKIGLYTIVLDQEGRPAQIKLQRKAYNGFRTVAWKFTSEDELRINQSPVDESVDAETAVLAAGGIDDVRWLEVTDSLGQSFSLSLDAKGETGKVVFKTPATTAKSEDATDVFCQARRDAPEAPTRTLVHDDEEIPVAAPVAAKAVDVRRPSQTE